MKKSGKIKYPEYIKECALYIGRLRNLYSLNNKGNEYLPEFSKDNETVHELGVMGELIFSHFLHESNVEHRLSSLLSNGPMPTCDIVTDKYKIDVKTVGSTARFFLVGIHAFNKVQDVDYYAFVKVLNNKEALYHLFSREDVRTWPVRKIGSNETHTYTINQ